MMDRLLYCINGEVVALEKKKRRVRLRLPVSPKLSLFLVKPRYSDEIYQLSPHGRCINLILILIRSLLALGV